MRIMFWMIRFRRCAQAAHGREDPWPISISPSSAAASTAPASPATRPAAGLRVLLVEQNDLASGTSSRLDQADPRRAALSRARLVSPGARSAHRARGAAAHGAAPDPADALRAAAGAGLAAGLDAARWACSSTTISAAERSCRRPAPSILRTIRSARRCRRRYRTGFEYSDCRADDSRLVVLNALDAAERGADDPHPHALHRAPSAATCGGWCSRSGGRREIATARVLVNATGPWLELFGAERAARAAAP